MGLAIGYIPEAEKILILTTFLLQQITIQSLSDDDQLADTWKVKTAGEMLWALLSVSNFEQLTVDRKWSTKQYVKNMQLAARQLFVRR